MKRPERILDIFRSLSDEAARYTAELRRERGRTMTKQVETLQSVEKGYNDARRDRSSAPAAAAFAQRQFAEARALGRKVEAIAEEEVHARAELLERFADQKRFEVFLSQRQIKERAVERKREEAKLLEHIDQLAARRDKATKD